MIRVVAVIGLLCMTGCGPEKTTFEQYPGPWQSEPKIEIVKLLVANNARGCGEFYWRTRDGETGPYAEYLVYCTRDGRQWTAWLLWPRINRAAGPAAIYPDIAPPSR